MTASPSSLARRRAGRAVLGAVLLGLLSSSCAYYNTFYLAKKYYFRATEGQPYEVDRQGSPQAANYSKSIEFAKKVMSSYPKSKWVDDAYLMWAKSLIGRDDPLQTVNMLQDFTSRYPGSPVRDEARFFLGVALRQGRKYAPAVEALDGYLAAQPKGELAPYAHLERARALVSLERYGEAADAAGHVLNDFPKSVLVDRARLARAEARFKQGDFKGAREDFRVIGSEAPSDELRFQYLLREADCLEAGREYDAELALLREALSHEQPPAPAANTTTVGQATVITQVAQGADRYGRLSLRIGTALLLNGKLEDGLQQYRNVIQDYPRSNLSAEAQYRIGYAYETVGDDFDRAVIEYNAVKEQAANSAFGTQAQQRLANLDRIKQYRTGSGADSLEKRAEAGFLVAEQYLFQLDKPERALEEYRRVGDTYPGTPVAGRALNAQAWVLSRKLGRTAEADSLFWKVVHEYPGTEAQLAARDYLEQTGQRVDEKLIVAPKVVAPPPPDTTALTPPPGQTPTLAPPPGGVVGPGAVQDSVLRARMFGGGRPRGGLAPGPIDSLARSRFPAAYFDSLGHPILPARPDSSRRLAPAPPVADTSKGGRP